MKRKIIQIGNSTQLVSLPRSWVKKYKTKKGQEIDIKEEENRLIISTENIIEYTPVEIDITDYDLSSALHAIQGAYRFGYDEIKVKFSKKEIFDFKKKKEIAVFDAVNIITSRLIGMEIISKKKDYFLIKDVSATSSKEFDNILRRIFLLLIEMSSELINIVQNRDMESLGSIVDAHDNITKFTSFCLRLLNKKGHEDYRKTPFLFHIIASIDKVTDNFKYISKDLKRIDLKITKNTFEMIKELNQAIQKFYGFFYKFEKKNIVSFVEMRRNSIFKHRNEVRKIGHIESVIIGRCFATFDILLDLFEARQGIA
ncbi:hypothetical protein JXB41_02990 [Candidatus Woesearchaeota archaeon]|nr:hypothetical protein [Candidatus Woesearchaeota archaeon]